MVLTNHGPVVTRKSLSGAANNSEGLEDRYRLLITLQGSLVRPFSGEERAGLVQFPLNLGFDFRPESREQVVVHTSISRQFRN